MCKAFAMYLISGEEKTHFFSLDLQQLHASHQKRKQTCISLLHILLNEQKYKILREAILFKNTEFGEKKNHEILTCPPGIGFVKSLFFWSVFSIFPFFKKKKKIVNFKVVILMHILKFTQLDFIKHRKDLS